MSLPAGSARPLMDIFDRVGQDDASYPPIGDRPATVRMKGRPTQTHYAATDLLGFPRVISSSTIAIFFFWGQVRSSVGQAVRSLRPQGRLGNTGPEIAGIGPPGPGYS